MTILGVSASHDSAIMWADTETFRDSMPSGHVCKLATSAAAIAVGAGAGWLQVTTAGAEAVNAAVDFDDLLDLLPGRLRHAAARAADRRPDPHRLGENVFVAAGWSPRFSRVIAYELHAIDGFEPVPTQAFASPEAPELAALHVRDPEDIAGLAQQQLADLQRTLPAAGAGLIAVATVTAEGITTRRYSLATGLPLGARGSPSFVGIEVESFAGVSGPVRAPAPEAAPRLSPALRVIGAAAPVGRGLP